MPKHMEFWMQWKSGLFHFQGNRWKLAVCTQWLQPLSRHKCCIISVQPRSICKHGPEAFVCRTQDQQNQQKTAIWMPLAPEMLLAHFILQPLLGFEGFVNHWRKMQQKKVLFQKNCFSPRLAKQSGCVSFLPAPLWPVQRSIIQNLCRNFR